MAVSVKRYKNYNVIRLDDLEIDCYICGKSIILEYSLPFYEGRIVDTNKTDEWAGQGVCKECYDKNIKGSGR